MPRIQNLAGVFTGEGFFLKQGRKPDAGDCGWRKGPVDIAVDAHGKIISIDANPSPASNASIGPCFDGSGLVATAGFVDSHTHTLFGGDRSKEFFLRWRGASYNELSDAGGGIHNSVTDTQKLSDEALRAELARSLHKMLRAGTTTVEVKTGYSNSAVQELRLLRVLKAPLPGLELAWPRLYTTFLALHALPKGVGETGFVDSMIALLPTIQREKLAHFADAFPERGFFSLGESLRFAKAALAHGLKLKIHADELSDLGSSLAFTQLGALSIDHLQKISVEAIRALSTAPTVATLLPATSFFLDLEYTNARRLIDAGARFALATDFNPGTAPESSFQLTQRLAASKMKMSAAEIFCASTYGGAAALGIETQLGCLKPGHAADVLLWKPSSLSENALDEIFVGGSSPDTVFRNGLRV